MTLSLNLKSYPDPFVSLTTSYYYLIPGFKIYMY